MWDSLILLGVLVVLAWMDMRWKELPLWLLAISGVAGTILYVMEQPFSVGCLAGGAAIGGVVCLAALVSKESIGMGDGILLCVTGLYLGGWRNLLLFFLASVFASAAAVVMLVVKKGDRKSRLPFVPCLLAADVILPLIAQ